MGVENHDSVNVEIGKWSKFEINVRDSVDDSIWRAVHSNLGNFILMLNVNHADNGPYMTYMSADVSNLPQNLDFILKIVKDDSPAQYLSRSNVVTVPIKKWSDFTIKCELVVYENQQENLPDMISEFKNNLLRTKLILIAKDGHVETTLELLYARSSVIRSMLKIAEKVGDEPMKEIKLIDYKKDVLQEFIRFLESDELSGNTPYSFQLLELGQKYDVQLLKKKAEQLVVHHLSNDNIERCYKLLCVTSTGMLAAHLDDTFDKLQEIIAKDNLDLSVFKRKAVLARTLERDFTRMNMRNIKLIASDGHVRTKRELLIARSEIFEDMLDSNEEIPSIDMKDYSKDVISEFVNFLMNDEIDDQSENLVQLLLLAHEYDVPLLKSITRQIIIEDKKTDDINYLHSVLAKTSPDILWNHFKYTYQDIKKRSGLIDIDGKLFSKDENKFI